MAIDLMAERYMLLRRFERGEINQATFRRRIRETLQQWKEESRVDEYEAKLREEPAQRSKAPREEHAE